MLLNLTGKKILVTGIANNRSIAWGIAQQLSKAGAELGITYLPDDKGRFESKVRELTEPLKPSLFLPLDVQNPAQIEEIFKNIKNNEKVWILSAQPLRTRTLLFEHECNANFLINPNDIDEAYKSINNSTPLILKIKNNYEIEGFYLPIWKVVLITDKELFSQQSLFNNVFIRRKKRRVNSNIN